MGLLQEREDFLQECDDFESKASDNNDRLTAKGSSLAIQSENKFRAYAAKKIISDDADAEAACRAYHDQTGRVFEVDGVNYLEIIREQKFERPQGHDTLRKLESGKISLKAKQDFSGVKSSNLL